MPPTDAALIRHLAEKVCGLDIIGWRGEYLMYRRFDGEPEPFNPTENWADAGMVWERAREDTITLEAFAAEIRNLACKDMHITLDLFWFLKHATPRIVSVAVARATGWEGEDGE